MHKLSRQAQTRKRKKLIKLFLVILLQQFLSKSIFFSLNFFLLKWRCLCTRNYIPPVMTLRITCSIFFNVSIYALQFSVIISLFFISSPLAQCFCLSFSFPHFIMIFLYIRSLAAMRFHNKYLLINLHKSKRKIKTLLLCAKKREKMTNEVDIEKYMKSH